jgi:hypothetical protein
LIGVKKNSYFYFIFLIMKTKILLLFTLFFIAKTEAQEIKNCGTDLLMERLMNKNPLIKEKRKLLDQQSPKKQLLTATYNIPIVFHILHQNGPENISDAQVRDGLRILNEDFSKTNPDINQIIPSFNFIADSTRIRFVLPTLDPQGNCTNGIIHHYDPNTNWSIDFSTNDYTWDPTRYLNIYIVKTIDLGNGFSAAGYTYLPGSWPDGANEDAIVMLNNYFGSIGTGNYFISRVLTHEIGHWLNLYHVFGGSNSAGVDCSSDDFVDDTPTTAGFLFCPDVNNPSSYQICTPGVDENFQNYMDYSYCCKMFTAGQGQRMRDALDSPLSGRNNLWTAENLATTGVNNLQSNCAPQAAFYVGNNQVCVGTPVTFFDNSWNGFPQFYNWSFPGGNPSISTEQNPIVVYNNPGIYSVTFSCGNSSGTSSPVTLENIVNVIENSTGQYENAWDESFEISTVPGQDWRVNNNSGGAQWQWTSETNASGMACAKMPREFNFRYNVAQLIGPSINLSSISAPLLSFKLAAAEVFPEHVNTLKVFASADCEQSWIELYSRTGQQLLTSSSTEPGFIPQNSSDWRTETVNLTTLANEDNVVFKFVYYRDSLPQPNNLFIDDVNIGSPDVILGKNSADIFEVYPNPSNGYIFVRSSSFEQYHTELFDSKGVLVSRKDAITGLNERISVSENKRLEKGLYLLKIFNTKHVLTKKVIVE